MPPPANTLVNIFSIFGHPEKLTPGQGQVVNQVVIMLHIERRVLSDNHYAILVSIMYMCYVESY